MIPVEVFGDAIGCVEQGIAPRSDPVQHTAPVAARPMREPSPGTDMAALHVDIEYRRQSLPDDLVRARLLRLVASVIDYVDHRGRLLLARCGAWCKQRAESDGEGEFSLHTNRPRWGVVRGALTRVQPCQPRNLSVRRPRRRPEAAGPGCVLASRITGIRLSGARVG